MFFMHCEFCDHYLCKSIRDSLSTIYISIVTRKSHTTTQTMPQHVQKTNENLLNTTTFYTNFS